MALERSATEAKLREHIEYLHRVGCNAVFFQVRAEGDAWYKSSLEPYSKYFTGEQGRAPREDWDPLSFVIKECHARGMELHAWINPYRGASNVNGVLSDKHLFHRAPELFITYNGQLILDPGNPKGRYHVLSVIQELLTNYDLDGLHLDDYFYPYPVRGIEFPDETNFLQYGLTAGYKQDEKSRWRRDNVNTLIREIRSTINRIKPWVRFGISPFGIYRNASSYNKGSATSGLQNYDDLYADVLHWVNNDWIDYIVPQVYWNIGHKVADYTVLVEWWSKALSDNPRIQLYIGQDIKRSMDGNQLKEKLLLSQKNTSGDVYWPADKLIQNYRGVSHVLREHYQSPLVLLPEQISSLGETNSPQRVKHAWLDKHENTLQLVWADNNPVSMKEREAEEAFRYAVYAFPKGKRVDLKASEYLLQVSNKTSCDLSKYQLKGAYTLVVTAINRFWQESKPYKLKVQL